MIKLPPASLTTNGLEGIQGEVAGWGLTEYAAYNKGSDILKETKILIVGEKYCVARWKFFSHQRGQVITYRDHLSDISLKIVYVLL